VTAPTCECDLGSSDVPDICGRPAEWMQPLGIGDDIPMCNQCADEDAYPIEEGP